MKIFMVVMLVFLAVMLTTWITRAIMARSLPDLEPWHQPLLKSEYRARNYRKGISFEEYQNLESRLMQELEQTVESKLTLDQQLFTNRYFQDSPAHRNNWPKNWNLSFEKIPEKPRGGVVLLHGASDSPYSMRSLADVFYQQNFYVIAIRLPGNGTIPGELTTLTTKDWTSITDIGVTEARKHINDDQPVYIGGFSTGASLALDYSLRAMEHPRMKQVQGLLLFSPAVEVSDFVSFAVWDYRVSRIPGFRKFGWASVRPEYDPFKYASFPKNVGHLVYVIARKNNKRIDRLKAKNLWENFPPVLTFQSIVDTTISVQAVVDLHDDLSDGDSELVLFDVNRDNLVKPFLQNDGIDILYRVTSGELDEVDITLVTNQSEDSDAAVAKRHCNEKPNCSGETLLNVDWPDNVVSLSHVALPFSPNDPLYGTGEAPGSQPYNLTRINVKGERRVLVIPAEDLNRLRYNPFHDYMIERILKFVGDRENT